MTTATSIHYRPCSVSIMEWKSDGQDSRCIQYRPCSVSVMEWESDSLVESPWSPHWSIVSEDGSHSAGLSPSHSDDGVVMFLNGSFDSLQSFHSLISASQNWRSPPKLPLRLSIPQAPIRRSSVDIGEVFYMQSAAMATPHNQPSVPEIMDSASRTRSVRKSLLNFSPLVMDSVRSNRQPIYANDSESPTAINSELEQSNDESGHIVMNEQ